MNNQILLTAILCLFLSFNSNAQCPVGDEAVIIGSTEIGAGLCEFKMELNFHTSTANNTSITFTIAIDGGATLLTTACFGNLSSNTFYTVDFSDPLLQAPCTSDLVVTYNAFNSPSCGGSSCSPPFPGNIVPVLGSLPVDLVSFGGHEEKFDKVKLEWVTASEDQNAYFSVERSGDGRNFEEIGLVEGSGNSSSTIYYSFMDNRALRGENYYRLKQVGLDNSFTYSDVILVENRMEKTTVLTVAPSITKGEVALIFNELPKENGIIEVYNSAGVNIISTTLAEGEYTLNLDLADYDPGMYFIRVPIGKEFVIKKFIKVLD